MGTKKDKEYRRKALPLYISILERLKKEAEQELLDLTKEHEKQLFGKEK